MYDLTIVRGKEASASWNSNVLYNNLAFKCKSLGIMQHFASDNTITISANEDFEVGEHKFEIKSDNNTIYSGVMLVTDEEKEDN